MKNRLILLAFVAILSLFACSGISAQAGNVGAPIVDVQTVAVCDDGTTAIMVLQFTIGITDPVVLGYFDEDGAAYTLSGNTLTVGACDGSGPGASNVYNFQFDRLCDDGTPFYRIALFTDNTVAPTSVTDYELDLSTAYTVSGTVSPGPCVASSVTTLNRNLSTATGTIASGTLTFTICNQGTEVANVTTSAVTSDLYPGECWSYAAVYDPSTQRYRTTPAISYDANGSRLIITTSN